MSKFLLIHDEIHCCFIQISILKLVSGKTMDSSPGTPNGTAASPVASTPTAVSRGSIKGLVEQIERLQSEKATLYDEIMTLRSSAAKNWQSEFEMLRTLNVELQKEKRRLEEEINNIQLSMVSSRYWVWLSPSGELGVHIVMKSCLSLVLRCWAVDLLKFCFVWSIAVTLLKCVFIRQSGQELLS